MCGLGESPTLRHTQNNWRNGEIKKDVTPCQYDGEGIRINVRFRMTWHHFHQIKAGCLKFRDEFVLPFFVDWFRNQKKTQSWSPGDMDNPDNDATWGHQPAVNGRYFCPNFLAWIPIIRRFIGPFTTSRGPLCRDYPK